MPTSHTHEISVLNLIIKLTRYIDWVMGQLPDTLVNKLNRWKKKVSSFSFSAGSIYSAK